MNKSLENPIKTDRPQRDTAKIRRCLKCRNEFPSEWAGERICARCKNKNEWRNSSPLSSQGYGGRS